MAQPPAGTVGSGQAAVPPGSGDEGDHGSRISCAAVLATVLERSIAARCRRSAVLIKQLPAYET